MLPYHHIERIRPHMKQGQLTVAGRRRCPECAGRMSVCDRPGELGSTPTGILTDGDYRETMEAVVGANPHEMRGCTDRLSGPYDMEVIWRFG